MSRIQQGPCDQLFAISILFAFWIYVCTVSLPLYILYMFIYVIRGTWYLHLCRWGGHVPCTHTGGICNMCVCVFVSIRLVCTTCVNSSCSCSIMYTSVYSCSSYSCSISNIVLPVVYFKSLSKSFKSFLVVNKVHKLFSCCKP